MAITTVKNMLINIKHYHTLREPGFLDLVEGYDLIVMKHCYPASDVLEDISETDPASPRKSLQNYKTVYRLLRDKFDEYPDKVFIVWTLPPRHRLFEPADGDKDSNAARATEFSNWLGTEFLNEEKSHPNIFVWDFRDIVMEPKTNFLKYEFELNHHSADSHPNEMANNVAGPQLARFITDTISIYHGSSEVGREYKIVFLHHSTGLNVYRYHNRGLPAWFNNYNSSHGTNYVISHLWYPSENNMPVNYYHSWCT